MIDKPTGYPSVFAFENESNTFLANKKKSLAATFKFTVARCWERTYVLALWLHIFKRDLEAIAVCDFLMQKEFDGNISIWSEVAHAIGLKYTIEKQLFDYPKEQYRYLDKIFEAQEKNAKMRSKNETDLSSFAHMYNGFLNGQIIEQELWDQEITFSDSRKPAIIDSCQAIIRELCWLIAANEHLGRTSFYIGGHRGETKLFWSKYHGYMEKIRKIKRIE